MPAGSGDVLVVDDDEVVRGLLVWLFEDAGYRVREAVDGAEALDALVDEAPDLLVLDLMMPNIDGQTVLDRRSEQGLAPDTRVIVLTAKSERQDEVWCWERGADEFVRKPFDAETLMRLAAGLMDMTPAALRHRREVGLTEARRLDALETAFDATATPAKTSGSSTSD